MSFLEENKLGMEPYSGSAFIFQAYPLPHNCFPVVAVAGKMQAAKSGGGGRPCPISAIYAYHFRPFADE